MEELIKQQNEEFEDKLSGIFYRRERTGVDCTNNKNKVKSFILLARSQILDKIVEECDKKMVFDPANMPYGYEDPATVDGYNYALEHIKQFILKAKE